MKTIMTTRTALLALISFLAAHSNATTVYLDRFEAGGARPDGWLNRVTKSEMATYIKDGSLGDTSRSGLRAISISCPVAGNERWYLGAKDVIPAIGEETYTLAVWVKTENMGSSEAYISMDWLDENKKRIGLINSDRITADQNWTLLSVTGIAKPDTSFVRIVLYAAAAAPGSAAVVTFDDCQLTAASESSGLLTVQKQSADPVALYGKAVVSMWKSPLPNPDLPGAGYPNLPSVEHHVIFDATMETGGYNHHATMVRHNGQFYAMWSNQRYAEDAPGQKVLYAVSSDGKNWSQHQVLFPSLQPEVSWEGTGINLSANHWFIQGGKLYARAWCGATVGWTSNQNNAPVVEARTSEYARAVRKRYNYLYREVFPNGELGPVASFTPEELPKDILIPVGNMLHLYPKFDETSFTPDASDVIESSGRRLCEPAYYQTPKGEHVLILRDDNYSHRKWVSFSPDGTNWSPAAPTDIPDSPSASAALTLSDGTVLLFGNHMAPKFDSDSPRHYGRDPLMLSVSRDGKQFTKTYAIRSGKAEYSVPPEMVKGRGGGGAQYPAVLLVDQTVYVIYSMGKEDIWISTFSLDRLSGI